MIYSNNVSIHPLICFQSAHSEMCCCSYAYLKAQRRNTYIHTWKQWPWTVICLSFTLSESFLLSSLCKTCDKNFSNGYLLTDQWNVKESANVISVDKSAFERTNIILRFPQQSHNFYSIKLTVIYTCFTMWFKVNTSWKNGYVDTISKY